MGMFIVKFEPQRVVRETRMFTAIFVFSFHLIPTSC